MDESQRIVLYNQAAERIFGWPAAEIRGQPLARLIPERFRDPRQGTRVEARIPLPSG